MYEKERAGWETHACAVNGPDLETGGVVAADLFLEFIRVGERVVPQVHISLERECKFAVGKHPCRNVFVVEPRVDGLEGIKSSVECAHDFGRNRLDFLLVIGGHDFVFNALQKGGESEQQASEPRGGWGWVEELS